MKDPFLNTNFGIKFKENVEMMMFTAHLSVAIKCLTRIQAKSSFGRHVGGYMAANTNHTILLKNQSAIKYLP